MNKTEEQPKKCYCARCFLPIDPEDKVDIDGQNFHRLCSMCCICRSIPTSAKMFYGHVFCSECFKTHILNRFRGDAPRIHSNSWWMQWAPGAKPESRDTEDSSEANKDGPNPPEEPPKKCICARCLQQVNENNKVEIGGQSFHPQCARCYICHAVPKNSVKIYYGQVFCEECFHRHVLNRNRDNPSEFFKNCFEQWQGNAQFAESMREFMAGNKDTTPLVFMMAGGRPDFCKCGNPQEHFQQPQPNEPRKSATPALSVGDDSLGTWDLSFENRTEASDVPESNESAVQENTTAAAAEKIEKLTKYLYERSTNIPENIKKWKNFDFEYIPGWVDLQQPEISIDCPRCLWQCGTIYVNSECMQTEMVCGDFEIGF